MTPRPSCSPACDTATSSAANDFLRLRPVADLPQRPRATSTPRVRIEGSKRLLTPGVSHPPVLRNVAEDALSSACAGVGGLLLRVVDWRRGLVRVSDAPGRRRRLPVAALTPLDDAGRDPATVAQIDLVVSATDPGPDRLIRQSAVASLPVMGYLQGTWHLPCRDQSQRPGRRPRPPIPGSQTGSQRRQMSGDIRRQPAILGAARCPVRPRPATCSDGADAPEKRKAGGSIPPLTTSFAM
jgi:hypothetical protein